MLRQSGPRRLRSREEGRAKALMTGKARSEILFTNYEVTGSMPKDIQRCADC